MSNHLPRQQRELNFLRKVRSILERGGNVLLPVVALGRAQVKTLHFVYSNDFDLGDVVNVR